MQDDDRPSALPMTRRDMLCTGAVAAAAVTLPPPPAAAASLPSPPPGPGATIVIATVVNTRPVTVAVDARTSLLDLLRERLALPGAKNGCDHGQCGACTVHVEGRGVAACLTLAVKVDGRAVTTIEGLGKADALHPMQQAFIDHDALQCGYCTPGQIMSAVACVAEGAATSRAQIREQMSGNICRCGAYAGIVAAVEDAASKMGRG